MTPAAAARTVGVRRVLLVEDDPAWAELTREAFADVAPDVRLEIATNGDLALERLREAPGWDLVVLDLNMPGRDGRDILRALRAGTRMPTDVVVLSASVAEADRQLATTLGARGYLTKPTSFGALLDMVRDLLGVPVSAPRVAPVPGPERRAPAAPAAATAPTITGQRVVLIEDSPLEAALVADQLEPAGFTVRCASSVAAFRTSGLDAWADCVLLDLDLPNATRLDALHAVREKAPTLPVIVLTGAGREALSLAALAAGAEDWIEKGSLRPEQLARAIRFAVERKRLEDDLQAEREFLTAVLGQVDAGIVACDAEGRLTLFNRVAEELYGTGPDPTLAPADWPAHYGLRRDDGTTPLPPGEFPLLRALAGETVREAEFVVCRPDRARRDVVASGQPVKSPSGRLLGAVLAMHDITERKRSQAALAHLALHDSLTGLPNRVLMTDRLEAAVARATRTGDLVGVLYIDLDHFKHVNDNRGHDFGDLVLRNVGERVADALRVGDSVGRLGGDEFMAVCGNLPDAASADELAGRVVDALARPMIIDGKEVTVTASVGVVLADGMSNPKQLVGDADTAMYEAKRQGRGRSHLFSEPLAVRAATRARTESELRVALRDHQLGVVYQPIVDLDSGEVESIEALVRWHHPDRGSMLPGDFLTVAEDSDLILALGEFVLLQACGDAAAGRLPGATRNRPPTVAVNIAARQAAQPDLADVVRRVLGTTGLAPHRLCLELTESALLVAADSATRELETLRAMGVRLALDDFGTGFASLSYLRNLPVDMVKIDRSFVAGLPGSAGDAAIVTAVLGLAGALGLDVVAEGVEAADQLAFLRQAGCRLVQGHLLGRPRGVG